MILLPPFRSVGLQVCTQPHLTSYILICIQQALLPTEPSSRPAQLDLSAQSEYLLLFRIYNPSPSALPSVTRGRTLCPVVSSSIWPARHKKEEEIRSTQGWGSCQSASPPYHLCPQLLAIVWTQPTFAHLGKNMTQTEHCLLSVVPCTLATPV